MAKTNQPNKSKKINRSLIGDLKELLRYLKPHRRFQLFFLLILMILSSLSEVVSLGAIFPFLSALSNANLLLNNSKIKPILNFFSISTSSQLVLTLAIAFIIAVIISSIIRILTINIQTHLAAKISGDLSCEIYRKTILQTYEFHVLSNSSDLISSVTEDTKQLTINILIPLVSAISTSFVALALIIGLFWVNGIIALFSIVLFGGSFIIIYQLRKSLLFRNSRILVENNQQQIKIVQESLGGIRDVLLGGSQSLFQKAYKNADYPYRQAVASNTVISLTPRYIIEGLAMSAMGILALTLGKDGDFSRAVPILGGLALGANRLLPALQQTFSALVRIQGARSSLKRILIGLQRSIDPLQNWLPQEKLFLENELRLQNIWFRYRDNTDWILKDLNLTIKAKTTIAFVGSTGSGKSTTADLILGLLKPQQGQILVDGLPLEGEKLAQWQRSIAHVPQSIFLMDATIAENIAFGIPYQQIDLPQVRKAAQLAQIDEFIMGLPASYDTYVGERGVRLSGGQRQRIGIARALYGDASVIVFDEATSALDNATEKEVMNSLESLSHQFTLILIAHRLTTVEKCDRIFELSQGQVIAEGTYQELLDKSTNFRRMATLI
ncbi:ABC transporter ATP-binding protein [Geminocystis sp. GBBB08]|uniref:ABC transporter ATP-binding protein n=1 Tax=Geminocystis sp. GBBB08 TaxID=2604140 RepID=UPI0027E295E7|nr:ABC transporter ATP-binding protein [Geminocystis sp. GBBB08]MBL1209492.1 ABC transporter ATP-binding protein [Geminocystis sp. GBBB08]